MMMIAVIYFIMGRKSTKKHNKNDDGQKIRKPDMSDYYGQYYQNTDTKDAHPLAKHSTYVLGTNSTGFYDGAAIPHQLATKLNHAPTRTQKNSNLPRHANCRIYWTDNTDTNVGQPIIAPLRNIKKGEELLLDYGHTYKYDTFNRDGTANNNYVPTTAPTTVPTPRRVARYNNAQASPHTC